MCNQYITKWSVNWPDSWRLYTQHRNSSTIKNANQKLIHPNTNPTTKSNMTTKTQNPHISPSTTHLSHLTSDSHLWPLTCDLSRLTLTCHHKENSVADYVTLVDRCSRHKKCQTIWKQSYKTRHAAGAASILWDFCFPRQHWMHSKISNCKCQCSAIANKTKKQMMKKTWKRLRSKRKN